MKMLVLPVLALAMAAFSLPAAAEGCPWSHEQSAEKPAEESKPASS